MSEHRTVKIGEAEFELPFASDGIDVYDSTGTEICSLDVGGYRLANKEAGQVIVAALNAYVERELLLARFLTVFLGWYGLREDLSQHSFEDSIHKDVALFFSKTHEEWVEYFEKEETK